MDQDPEFCSPQDFLYALEESSACQTASYSSGVIGAYDVSCDQLDNDDEIVVDGFGLGQNYPNPFNPITSISFSTPTKQMIRIEIFDLHGRLINTIYEGIATPGEHTVRWDGTNSYHNSIPSGVYFYRLTSENYFKTRKMLYLK